MKKFLFVPLLFALVACGTVATPTNQNSTVNTIATGTYSSQNTNSTTSSGDILSTTTNSNMNSSSECNTNQLALPVKGEEIAVITTNFGVIKARLFDCDTPKTVENFKELAKKGFYDGLIFHRVINDFMIQGGDPKGVGVGGETFNGKPLVDEVSPAIKHLRGTLSMAKTSMPNSATSQFFIVQNHSGTSFLDGGYTAFGQAFEGLDIVDKIAKVRTNPSDKPLEDVKMESIKIVTY